MTEANAQDTLEKSIERLAATAAEQGVATNAVAFAEAAKHLAEARAWLRSTAQAH